MQTPTYRQFAVALLSAALFISEAAATSPLVHTDFAEEAYSEVAVSEETPSVSATDAVLRLSGRYDALAKADSMLAEATPEIANSIGFLDMAHNNRNVAQPLRFQGYFQAAAYFDGRADGFELAAKLTGK